MLILQLKLYSLNCRRKFGKEAICTKPGNTVITSLSNCPSSTMMDLSSSDQRIKSFCEFAAMKSFVGNLTRSGWGEFSPTVPLSLLDPPWDDFFLIRSMWNAMLGFGARRSLQQYRVARCDVIMTAWRRREQSVWAPAVLATTVRAFVVWRHSAARAEGKSTWRLCWHEVEKVILYTRGCYILTLVGYHAFQQREKSGILKCEHLFFFFQYMSTSTCWRLWHGIGVSRSVKKLYR